jgi:hypothetical protein
MLKLCPFMEIRLPAIDIVRGTKNWIITARLTTTRARVYQAV